MPVKVGVEMLVKYPACTLVNVKEQVGAVDDAMFPVSVFVVLSQDAEVRFVVVVMDDVMLPRLNVHVTGQVVPL